MKLDKQLVNTVGKMRLEGASNAEVRDALSISEDHASKAWAEYRAIHKLPAARTGPKARAK